MDNKLSNNIDETGTSEDYSSLLNDSMEDQEDRLIIVDDMVPETGSEVEIASTETVYHAQTLYCHCKQPWSQEFMIMCDNCRNWFHGNCVNVTENESLDIDKYHCSKCESIVGKSRYKNVTEKGITAGSELFIERLKLRTFANANVIVSNDSGSNLKYEDFLREGFSYPIIIKDKAGLDIQVPKSLSVCDVLQIVGPHHQVEVINVETQGTLQMTLREFVDYYTQPNRKRRLNLISLEVSETPLGKRISPPKVARELDWVLNCWPDELLNDMMFERPKVSKYCLIGTEDSYTDFHIDFGGTSVWYHILWGEKVFYLIEPTEMNLSLYEKWMSSSPKDKYEAFFGDTVDYCYKLVLQRGQTLFIPCGWIHAVLTTEDSLVFGGNFLHSLHMDMQFKVYNIERNLKIMRRYMFPSFQTVHWLACSSVIKDLKRFKEEGRVPKHFRVGAKALIRNLGKWLENERSANENIPSFIHARSVLKELKRALSKERKPKRVHEEESSVPTALGCISNKSSTITSYSVISHAGTENNGEFNASCASQQKLVPRIKLTIKKDPNTSGSSNSSPSYSSSLHSDEVYTIGTNGINSHESADSQKEGSNTLKIRLSTINYKRKSSQRNYIVEGYNSSTDSGGFEIDTNGNVGKDKHVKRKRRQASNGLDAKKVDTFGPSHTVTSPTDEDGLESSDLSLNAGVIGSRRTQSIKGKTDNDYFYPSVAVSSDEDDEPVWNKTKKKEDKIWSPSDNHTFTNVKAEDASKNVALKQNDTKYKNTGSREKKKNDANVSPANVSATSTLTSSQNVSTNGLAAATTAQGTDQKKRVKKGMATAKQRLSKILKIRNPYYKF